MQRRINPFLQTMLSLVLLFATSLPLAAQSTTATPQPTPAATPTLTYAQAKQQLADVMTKAEQLRKLLDRNQFDLDELSFALAGDAAKIIDFVTNEIAFEQYPGLLRGGQGTLMSRAGNALDQAVLLQQLLTDAGYEVKILHGTLSDSEATILVNQLFQPRKFAPPISQQMDKVKALLNDAATKAGVAKSDITNLLTLALNPPPVTSTMAYSATLDDSAYLQTLLSKADVTLNDTEAEAKLIQEAKDYFWVAYRLGPNQAWKPVQPAFGKATAPAKLTATESFADESKIPDALKQEFQMQVLIEHKVGDEIETRPLFAPLTGTPADMAGRRHTFAIFADGFTSLADLADPVSALKKTSFFYPNLDGKLVADSMFFDLLGNLVPPDAATSPLAPLITGVSKSLGGALDALDSTTTPDELQDSSHFLLTGVYIEYTFTAPGQAPRVFRRTLVDRIGAENRAKKQWTLLHPDDPLPDMIALTAQHTFMLATGALPAAYLADLQLEHLLKSRPLFDFALGSQYQQPGFADLTKAKLDTLDLSWPGHPVIYAVADAGATATNLINYRPSASLVVYTQSQDAERMHLWMDVVNNERRTYKLDGGKLAVDVNALLKTGVWETRTEDIALDPKQADNTENVFTVFALANQQKIPIRVLTPADTAGIDKLALSLNAKTQLQTDLAAGNVVVLPEKMPTGIKKFGWWRIDQKTGQTLGVNEDGLGAAAIEYAALLRSVAFAGGCALIAGHDKNGLTVQDAIVCASVGVGGYGAMATLGVAGKITMAVAAMIGTGAWLNNSDGLQHPIIKP
ncbi:MAG: hypothetical protein NT075_04430 [Chloroflexi bacterium]|nr:hypothetical protein [Chloroflexota bacterium]